MTRVLLALICAFAAVSSTLADSLGFQTERVVAFSALAWVGSPRRGWCSWTSVAC